MRIFHTITSAGVAIAASATLALAQTPPTATTTFTGGNGTDWTDLGNWDTQIPAVLDDAWIGSGLTAAVTSAYLDANPFGTLTLGTNATLQLSAAGNTGLPGGSSIYFNNGAHLELTAGTINRSTNYYMLPGATATLTASNNDIPQGTLNGSGNLNVITKGNMYVRWDATAHSGNVTYSSNNGSARRVQLTRFGSGQKVGPGTTTFGNAVRVDFGSSNRIHDDATVRLVGGAGGGSNIKFGMGADRSDTIANLIVESPTASTGPYFQMRNGWLRATDSVDFVGTAGTIQTDNALWPSQYEAGLDVRGADVTFGGTGDWSLTGDGQLRVDGSTTITTNTNATISNYLYGSGTIQKYGSGSLTLSGNALNLATDGQSVDFSGGFAVNAGSLIVDGSINSISMAAAGSQLTIGTAASAADTLTIGAGGLTFVDDSIINWQYNGATTAGTDYDTIISSATLDLTGLNNIIINGSTLGYEAQIGDSFTLFDGTVNGFDAGMFTLNLPTLTDGTWQIQEGSLVLTVIPEPSIALLGGLGLLGLLLHRRRN